MRKFLSLRIRTMMIVILITAVGFAAPDEYQNQVDCSSLADWADGLEDQARWEDRERIICLGKSDEDSYDCEVRQKANSESLMWIQALAGPSGCIFFTCKNWDMEAKLHETRIRYFRGEAESKRRESREIRAKLLLPLLKFQVF